MKKTYERKFFRQKLLSERKTVTAVTQLLIVLLLGFPLFTRAEMSGTTRIENISVSLSGNSVRQDSVVSAEKRGSQKLGFYEGEVMDTEGNPLPGVTAPVKRYSNGYFHGHAWEISFPGNKNRKICTGLLVYRDETGGKGRDTGEENYCHDGG